jgi:hypothetical protein
VDVPVGSEDAVTGESKGGPEGGGDGPVVN